MRATTLPFTPSARMTIAKTYPHKSAGPHYPSLPLTAPLLRLIPGNPRISTPPVIPLPNAAPLPSNLLLKASVDSSSATVSLPSSTNPIPQCFFDFCLDDLKDSFFTFTLHSGDAAEGAAVARLVLLDADFKARKGVIERPLLDHAGMPVALLTVDYQVITACRPGPSVVRESNVPRFVGHRGMGSSGSQAPWRVLENTPESFMMATLMDQRSNTVELDVQMTSDGKTVVYHDWFFRPGGGRDKDGDDGVKVPLYTMSFDQFDGAYRALNQGVEVGIGVRRLMRERTDIPRGVLEVGARSLRRLCEEMPEDVGMMVEVKYPVPNHQEDNHSNIPYAERNHLVDTVLAELFAVEKNQRRDITLSSFDADVCMLLSMKQKNYAVYFLNCEVIDKPCDEFDPRCIDVDEGLKFVQAQGLKGMVLFNGVVESKPGAVKRIREAGKALLTYGGRNCDPRFVENQFELGVNGVIADDIDELLDAVQVES
eukprot:GFKZ01007901.1.p1 GENE.GFKZ01007901.1~~GFKZ01007901.1.p1  ORF type:complete len:483 (+),score=75.81 GFKZ01007901.1:293-1741(+)